MYKLKDCLWIRIQNWEPDVQINHANKSLSTWLLESGSIKTEKEALQEILDILLIEPLSDYFHYQNDRLFYLSPLKSTSLPGNSFKLLRVDKERIKTFLRNYKLKKILN
jgi:hypothetical protein